MSTSEKKKKGKSWANGKIGAYYDIVKKTNLSRFNKVCAIARKEMGMVGDEATLEQKQYLDKHKKFNELDKMISFRDRFEQKNKRPLYTPEELAQIKFKEEQLKLAIEKKKQPRQSNFSKTSPEKERIGRKRQELRLGAYRSMAERASKEQWPPEKAKKLYENLRKKVYEMFGGESFERRIFIEKNINFVELNRIISFRKVYEQDKKIPLYSQEETILRDKVLSGFVWPKKRNVRGKAKELKKLVSTTRHRKFQLYKTMAGFIGCFIDGYKRKAHLDDGVRNKFIKEAIEHFKKVFWDAITKEDRDFLKKTQLFKKFQNITGFVTD